ncbi:GCN5-like N-acetyltransferase [Halovivax asiaticus JCM 14624]|uniref:GCN5-like N-acetyltransferase n=1 Tax=Halovivax asiaticus JCM 14624 TaxID=1227490 RepID=M0BMT6_9EURY|nr:GNAT family N-acetyltransferase [Halovivax asiaticus]ELZ10929.1 GCN5-like N-acetyltransferase [Halovivax asiaticus JCM 14624]
MAAPATVPDGYTLRREVPTTETFLVLREAAGMPPRSRDGAERGLPNSLFGVTVVHEPTDEPVGMGRVVGDGGTVYQLCDMAVHPDHQGRGLGTAIMSAIDDWIAETAPPNAYVNLFADVDGFYERFGFEATRPASNGMFRRTE